MAKQLNSTSQMLAPATLDLENTTLKPYDTTQGLENANLKLQNASHELNQSNSSKSCRFIH